MTLPGSGATGRCGYVVFAVLWALFAVVLVRNRHQLDETWLRIRRLPLVVQGLAWLLALPVLVGLWIWHRPWPLLGRLMVITGLAGWNLVVMLPQAG